MKLDLRFPDEPFIQRFEQGATFHHPVRHGSTTDFDTMLFEHGFLSIQWQCILIFTGDDLTE